ncbi:hypothetical protein AAF712_013118 [Marasmius tenuissimus]|uniref:DUF985 domain-containing protein n=1 Tax=Marasmius tenuissimus TaxID=585030 RepID=A0ABR2ZEU8_9AGAR
MAGTPTDTLIQQLGLQSHPAGGYFLETDRRKTEIGTPFRPDAPLRALATTIYYLLTKDSPTVRKSSPDHNDTACVCVSTPRDSQAYHMHHQGRMEYTLITPGSPPKIETKVLGPDTSKGESRMIVVDPEVWKFARLLPEDLADEERAKEGCLMTMLLVPGFSLEDHEFMTPESLKALFDGVEGGEEWIRKFSDHVWRN